MPMYQLRNHASRHFATKLKLLYTPFTGWMPSVSAELGRYFMSDTPHEGCAQHPARSYRKSDARAVLLFYDYVSS